MTEAHAHHDGTLPHARWAPEEAPPEGQWTAVRRLANAVRRVNTVLMDTDAAEDELNRAAEQAEALAAALEGAPRGRSLWGYAEAATADSPRARFDTSPIQGLANPIAPPLRFRIVDGRVEGSGSFGSPYEGPPGHVHGGFIAAAFDELLGVTQSLSGIHGMTGNLNVRYRQPTPLHRAVRFEAWVDRVEGRKLFALGTLSVDGTLRAEAEGLFIAVGAERMRALAGQDR